MDRIKPLINDAIAELWSHKLRTILTLLGMIFGVGAVIAMLNIGEGAERQALKLIDSMGLRNLIVESKSFAPDELKEVRKESLGLNYQDMTSASVTLPFVLDAAAIRNVKTQSLYSEEAHADAEVSAVSPNYFELSNLKVESGAFFTDEHNDSLAQVAVLGSTVAVRLFPNDDAINQYVKINHLWFKVVGILESPHLSKSEFQGVKIGGESNKIYLPITTATKKLHREPLDSELDAIKIKINQSTNPVVAAKALTRLLDMRHNGVEDYSLVVPAALLAQQKQTQQIFNIVMACVAGISLLVGGIGIMNIMLANVLERTREIGLLRAIGATQDDIKIQFITESFTISVIGGILGVVFGLLLSEVIGFYSEWAVSWSLSAIVVSLFICLIVGVGFGAYPAVKASRLNPIDALHSD